MLSRSKAKRKAHMEKTRTLLTEKIRESLVSVLPIIAIVTVLCLFLVPMQPNLLLTFLIGALMIVVGLGLFSLGAERSMTIIGNKIGTALTKIGKLPVILLVAFALGVAVTVAEPDLQVLADTVPNIDKTVLLLAVGIGVGLFMVVCMLRILYGINLRWVLLGCYVVIFALAAFTDRDFLCIAFDSGGVTTGPMTVPFILALGRRYLPCAKRPAGGGGQLRSGVPVLHRPYPLGAAAGLFQRGQRRHGGDHPREL